MRAILDTNLWSSIGDGVTSQRAGSGFWQPARLNAANEARRAAFAEYGHVLVGEQLHRQESRSRMSSAPRVVPKTLPSSMTLENSLAFLAFSAMTFSSIVSLATRR